MQQNANTQQPTPQQVFKEAHQLLRVGDVYEASRRAGKLRAHFPDDTPILALHGITLAKMGIHAQALSDLIRAGRQTEEALKNDEEGNPARPRIVDQLIRVSVQICRSSLAINAYPAAEEAIENALQWDPDRADAVAAKAELLAALGQRDEAYKLIAQGFEDHLDAMPLTLAKARLLLGDEHASEDQLREIIPPLETEAGVAGLPVPELGDLLRALGMVHDRLGQHDEAFNAFRRAARLRRDRYDPRHYTTMTTKIITEWSLDNMKKLVKPDHSGQAHTLILGAPMSGVAQLGEMLGDFNACTMLGPLETLTLVGVQHLGARQGVLRPVPLEPTALRGKQLRDAGQVYMQQTEAIAGDAGSVRLDTHPHNIPLAGAAAVMLPGVNIVVCRRDPLDAALACYCDAMAGNHPYASDLLNTAAFVADSNRMLDHWAHTLGDDSIGANIVEVQYHELANDPQQTAARVANAIGVESPSPDEIERIPAFPAGPGTHPDAYRNYTKQIRDLLEPAGA